MENSPNIYIDGNNLYRGAKDLGHDLSYKKLRGWLRQKYSANEVYIFIGYIESREKYYEYLESCDYKLIFKKVVSVGIQVKGNCDAELVLKVVSDFYLKKFEKCIIITGDGDFGCLVEFLKENNAIYKIISPDFAKCSILLRDKNINIDFLNNHYHKFLNEKAPTADVSAEGSLS